MGNIKSSNKNKKNTNIKIEGNDTNSRHTSNNDADDADDAANTLASLNKVSTSKTTTKEDDKTTTDEKKFEKNNNENNKKKESNNKSDESSSVASTPNNKSSDKNVSASNSKGYKNRKGRKGDPRMHRAVAARMADPTMTLLDALRAGGFNYPLAPPNSKDEGDGMNTNSMYNVEDEEGVQLGQRKNQLSRRLRQLIRKGGSSCGGSSSGYSDSDGSAVSKNNTTKTIEGEDSDDDY